jgi:hypothetical protein
MVTPISKFADMTEVQLRGMIRHTQREYAFLDHSNDEAVYALARLMTTADFVSVGKVTPLRSSLLFLRRIGPQAAPAVPAIRERDFVFAIKMFGLLVRDKQGLLEFLPDNKWIDDTDAEGKPAILIDIKSEIIAREVEFEISDTKKHRKIHERRIDAGTNRLLRWNRDGQLAVLLAELVKGGLKIGEARELLRTEHDVKDHEYVRVRERALEIGLLQSTRSARRKNTRVTLDADVAVFIDSQARVPGRLHPRTPTQTVNQCLRDLYLMMYKKAMPPAPKVEEDDDEMQPPPARPAASVRLPPIPAKSVETKKASPPTKSEGKKPTAPSGKVPAKKAAAPAKKRGVAA